MCARYEKLKALLGSNEAAKALETNEQKLKHYEQSIFAMRECTLPSVFPWECVVVLRWLCLCASLIAASAPTRVMFSCVRGMACLLKKTHIFVLSGMCLCRQNWWQLSR